MASSPGPVRPPLTMRKLLRPRRDGSANLKRDATRPTGKSPTHLSSPHRKNISVHIWRKSLPHRCHPGPHKGAFRDRHERRAGMRWTLIARLTSALSCGRRSRVVLTPRRWRQVSQKCLRGDGGKQARSPGRARNKLLKPLRAGMPGDPGATVVTTSCAFYLCTRDCGCNGHPAFPAPRLG